MKQEEKDLILEAIVNQHGLLKDTDLYKLFAETARQVLINRFITPTMYEKDKEQVHNVYFLEDRFHITNAEFGDKPRFKVCGRKTDFVLMVDELLALVRVGCSEDQEMVRTFYMVK